MSSIFDKNYESIEPKKIDEIDHPITDKPISVIRIGTDRILTFLVILEHVGLYGSKLIIKVNEELGVAISTSRSLFGNIKETPYLSEEEFLEHPSGIWRGKEDLYYFVRNYTEAVFLLEDINQKEGIGNNV